MDNINGYRAVVREDSSAVEPRSRMESCIIRTRPGDAPLFIQKQNGLYLNHMVEYVIMPTEQYGAELAKARKRWWRFWE